MKELLKKQHTIFKEVAQLAFFEEIVFYDKDYSLIGREVVARSSSVSDWHLAFLEITLREVRVKRSPKALIPMASPK